MTYKLKDADKSNHCHTCRRQRLRCDGKKPSCQKCASRGVECLGYGAQPLLWVQPKSQASTARSDGGGGGSSSKDSALTTSRPGGKKKGRPKLVLMSSSPGSGHGNGCGSASGDSDADSDVGLPDSRVLNMFMQEMRARGYDDKVLHRRNFAILRGLEPVGYSSKRLIIDSLKYYDEVLCSDMVLVDAPDNPWRIPIELWRYIPDLLMDPIIAATMVHKLVRIQSSAGALTWNTHSTQTIPQNHLQRIKHPLLEQVFTFQHRQTKALAEMIADPNMRGSRALLEAVTTMVICEVQQSAFGDWVKHLDGAKAMIAARGGFAQTAKEIADEVNYELGIVMQSDVMRDVGSPSSLLQPNADPLQYLDHVETIYQDGTASVFPCSNELFTAVILTNDARHKLRHDPTRAATALAEHASIIRDILSFSPMKWATKQFDNPRLGWKFTEAFASADYNKEMLRDLARTFQLAALLYAIRTLFLDQGIRTVSKSIWHTFRTSNGGIGDDEDDLLDVQEMEAKAVDDLILTLREVWAIEHKAPAWFGKFTLWPLFMAGMSMDPGKASEEVKSFVCGSLSRICFHMGNFTPLDASWAIQYFWARTAKFERRGWMEDLPQEPLPGLFFS